MNGGLDVDAGGLTQSQSQSQSQNQTASQTLASLERNSFNFLEYVFGLNGPSLISISHFVQLRENAVQLSCPRYVFDGV